MTMRIPGGWGPLGKLLKINEPRLATLRGNKGAPGSPWEFRGDDSQRRRRDRDATPSGSTGRWAPFGGERPWRTCSCDPITPYKGGRQWAETRVREPRPLRPGGPRGPARPLQGAPPAESPPR